MAAEIVPLRPEVIRPEVLPGPRPTTGALLDRLASDVRSAVDRLSETDDPEALEVGRWLRARLGEVVAERIRQ